MITTYYVDGTVYSKTQPDLDSAVELKFSCKEPTIEAIAETYWHRHGDYCKELTMDVWDENEKYLGRYAVRVESEPVFSCIKEE